MTSAAPKQIGLATGAHLISRSASRYITARERKRALQACANAGVDGARPGSFVVLPKLRSQISQFKILGVRRH